MPPKRKFRGGAVSGRGRKSRRVSPTCKILTARVKCVVASTQFVGGSVTLGYNRIKKCHPYIYIYIYIHPTSPLFLCQQVSIFSIY